MGQAGYGYVSFERFWGWQKYWRLDLSHRFVKAAAEINEGKATAADFDVDLPTGIMTFYWLYLTSSLGRKTSPVNFSTLISGRVTEAVTAILEAGRRSLDNDGATVKILYDSQDWQQITDLKVVS